MIFSKRIKLSIFFIVVGFVFYSTQFMLSDEERILKKLSPEKKIGQLFIIGFEGKVLTPEIEDLFKRVHPGGIFLLSRNISDSEQLKKLILDLQSLSMEVTGFPLFIAIDQEGGDIRRIRWIDDKFPQSEIDNPVQAYQIGLRRGLALKELGINLNFAPVLDLTKEGDFLHNRTFQKEPRVSGELGKYIILGQKKAGIFTAIKHFPGYGGITFNPEGKKVPILPRLPEVHQFERAVEASPEFVMISNVVYTGIDSKSPFSFPPKSISFLRGKIKGDYLVISDDLSSKTVKMNYSIKDSVVFSIESGVDVLLIAGWDAHRDQVAAYNACFKAIRNGEIIPGSINNSVLKIIKLKKRIFCQGN